MLKKQNIKFSERKKFELSNTPGEEIRDSIIKLGVEAAKEAGYSAGNKTDKLIKLIETLVEKVDKVVEKAEKVGDLGVALVGGSESSASFGRIAQKTSKDIARGDKVCTGLCIVSGTCEVVALGCSTIKSIPFRGKIYTGAKILSKGCISYRNACAGEGC